jgi:hypothetical protein
VPKFVIIILAVFLIFSGCIEENNATQSNESVRQGSINAAPENLSSTTMSSEEENIPEIEITSFSSIYINENQERVYEYLFSWDDVPGSENQELISYLRKLKEVEIQNGLNIVGQSNALIVKSDDNKTINVYFTSRNATELTLEDRKKIVLKTPPDVELELKEGDGNHKVLITPPDIELELREVNGKLCVYKVEKKLGYNITEGYYAAYGLSIKNNGPKNLDFKLNDLNLCTENNSLNVTIEPENPDSDILDVLSEDSNVLDVLSDLEKETKLDDTTLFPGQTINGSVVFQVNSLYNESFLLMYNETPIPSASFGKSIEALKIVEGYNYSAIFDIPPYNSGSPGDNSFKPDLEEFPYIWANWVNRSIFEFFNRADFEDVDKSFREDKPRISIVYALKVIPERNITFVNNFSIVDDTEFPVNNFIVVDDAGKELIHMSKKFDKAVILKNQTYELHSEENMDTTQTNLSNATVVRVSFKSEYTWGHYSFIDQDVILDKKLNIIAARNSCRNFMS